jgi:WD40 repeat protein/DNA-binding SARP family transcriptional activator
VGNARKPRLVLAALLSKAGQEASVDWLNTVVWGDAPPASARRNIQLYVHQLRRALGAEHIVKRPGGYSIDPGSGLDAARFQALVGEGGAGLANGEPEAAARTLRRGLDLWRGPAYAEFLECRPLAEEATRLDRLRLSAYERWFEAELAVGRAAELTDEMADLVAEHPFHEGLLAQYMLALYRSGQQAQALETFRRARVLLDGELGVEPGPRLQRMHEAILRGDEDLQPSVRGGAVAMGATAGSEFGRCPFLGLRAFQETDRDSFFGRSRLVERLLGLIERAPVLGVFGASGSGKSSLLRAGLLGAIASDERAAERWRTLLITPTARPREALSRGVAELTGLALPDEPAALDLTVRTALAEGPAGTRALLVVDQFEELFTLCADAAERHWFIDALVDAALGPDRRTTVVLGVRADFLSHLTEYPGLVEALADEGQLLVGRPSAVELREMVVGPAARAGLRVADDLLATVLADAGTEPGALPLLSHALLETWRRREGAELTLRAYQATGGVRGAITKTAEGVWTGLTAEQRQAARRIFRRLTALGEGTQDTRRPVARAELDGLADRDVVAEVLDRLAGARLIVLGERTIEVAHESLIRAWPRLHRWLTDDYADLAVHRRLSQAAQTWDEFGRDPGALYRGAALLATRELRTELNRVETEFLQAGLALEEAEQGAVLRRNRRLQRLLATAAALLLLAILGGGVALHQREEAQRRQVIEQSHQLALRARSLLATEPDQAGLLAVEAFRRHPDAETRGAVLSTSAAARRRMVFNQGGRSVFKVTFNPDGTLLAAGDADGRVTLWDPRGRTRVAAFDDHAALAGGEPTYVRGLAFTADSRLLASTARAPGLLSSQGSLVVWDVPARRPVLRERLGPVSNAMAMSDDGTQLAIGLGNGTIQLRDLRTGRRLALGRPGEPVDQLVFDPSGSRLVSVTGAAEPVIWDTATGGQRATVPIRRLVRISFDPSTGLFLTASETDGIRFWAIGADRPEPRHQIPRQEAWAWRVSDPAQGRIAVADENGLITIWDIRRRRPLETYQDRARAETLSLALSRDGTKLASAGFGGTILIRDRPVPAFGGHGDTVNDLDVSPDGRTVASAGSDATVRLWDEHGTALGLLPGHSDHVEALAFHPDGRRLAAVTRDHTLTIWDVGSRQPVTTIRYDGIGASTDVGYAPGGRTLAVAALGRHRWDVTDPARPAQQAIPGPPTVATSLTFSPDGRFLISASPAGGVLIWDLAHDRRALAITTGHGAVLDVAASPDGTLIATAGADQTVKLWHARSGEPLATLSGHTAPVQALAFSRDGRTLASGGLDRTIATWDVPTRRHTATLTGHTARVHALAFTHDGDLISGGDDHRIIRWPLDPGTAITRICTQATRDLTPAERATCRPA